LGKGKAREQNLVEKTKFLERETKGKRRKHNFEKGDRRTLLFLFLEKKKTFPKIVFSNTILGPKCFTFHFSFTFLKFFCLTERKKEE
jgi:hypothetical protein